MLKGTCPTSWREPDRNQPATFSSARRLPVFEKLTVASATYFRGAERDRTVGLLSAIQALSQLSYSPNTLGGTAERGDILRRGVPNATDACATVAVEPSRN